MAAWRLRRVIYSHERTATSLPSARCTSHELLFSRNFNSHHVVAIIVPVETWETRRRYHHAGDSLKLSPSRYIAPPSPLIFLHLFAVSLAFDLEILSTFDSMGNKFAQKSSIRADFSSEVEPFRGTTYGFEHSAIDEIVSPRVILQSIPLQWSVILRYFITIDETS
jgi:hypothetical protein